MPKPLRYCLQFLYRAGIDAKAMQALFCWNYPPFGPQRWTQTGTAQAWTQINKGQFKVTRDPGPWHRMMHRYSWVQLCIAIFVFMGRPIYTDITQLDALQQGGSGAKLPCPGLRRVKQSTGRPTGPSKASGREVSSHFPWSWGHPGCCRSSAGWKGGFWRHRVPAGWWWWHRCGGSGGCRRSWRAARGRVGRDVAAQSGSRAPSPCCRPTSPPLTSPSVMWSWKICPSPSTCRTQILQVSSVEAWLYLSSVKVQCRARWLPLQMW